MKFWDSSAVTALCVEEPRSAVLRNIAEQDQAFAVWWTTSVECCSAFARLSREAGLTSGQLDHARTVLNVLLARCMEIEPSREVRERAARAVFLHMLRAADALQLAAALVWANGSPTDHEIVCLDHRLRDAAAREGFRLMPEL